MKKQLFIIIVALFAISFSNVYGQATHGSSPQTVSCSDNSLSPIAGKPYKYAATVNPTGGNFQWWAQKGTTFIQTAAGVTTNTMASRLTVASGGLISTSASYGTTSALDSVIITWSSATLAATTLASPTFVAVQYDAPPSGCANNLKVYKLSPLFAFVVDIKNVEDATKTSLAYGAAESQCVSPVVGAVYNSVTSEMEIDNGNDTLYFEVVAANFTNYWIPSFHLAGLLTGQAASMTWSYSNTFTPATGTYTAQAGVTGTPLTFSNSTQVAVDPSTNTNLGVSIYVRVIIQNQHNENLTGQNITLAVEGADADGSADINNATCVAPSSIYEDSALQAINPRPTVTPVGTGTFIPTTTP